MTSGTVFSIGRHGHEQVLHSFGSTARDGAIPAAGLVNLNGTLYGTTDSGGAHRSGTVFSITRDGVETVLYSFGTVPGDGAYPLAGLTAVGATLYGTTSSGGANGRGTVFSITP